MDKEKRMKNFILRGCMEVNPRVLARPSILKLKSGETRRIVPTPPPIKRVIPAPR